MRWKLLAKTIFLSLRFYQPADTLSAPVELDCVAYSLLLLFALACPDLLLAGFLDTLCV